MRSSTSPCPTSGAAWCADRWTTSRPRSLPQEKAQRKAKAEARKQLAHSRHEHNEAAVNAKVADLKAKLHHEEKTPVASGD